jgi:ferritin
MIKEKMEQALNGQLQAELYSSYLYLSMSGVLERMGLPGFANWMRVQTQEENAHGMKFYDHIIERGGTVKLAVIDAPPREWSSVLEICEATMEHEQKITGMINDLVDLAVQEKDHATNMFLQWFVTEQVEEEANVDDIIQKLKLTEEAKGALFLMDKDMAARVFVPPTSQGDN